MQTLTNIVDIFLKSAELKHPILYWQFVEYLNIFIYSILPTCQSRNLITCSHTHKKKLIKIIMLKLLLKYSEQSITHIYLPILIYNWSNSKKNKENIVYL